MKVTKNNYIRMIAEEAGITVAMVKKIYEAMEVVNESITISGNEFIIPSIGYTSIKYVKEKPEHEATNLHTMEKMIVPLTPEHNKVTIKVCKAMKDKLKEETLGKAYK